MSEEARFYGHLSTGEPVYEYTLNSASGISVKALNYGGIITAIEVPTQLGRRNVVLALDGLEAYESNPNYVGVLVGRYGGRLSTPVTVAGLPRHLTANDRGNCLHGGDAGFGKVIWQAQVAREDDAETLHLKYHSKAGEAGFPGNLMVHISYRLWQDGHFQIVYRAISDDDTPVGLTHHSYFNLDGGEGDVLNHTLILDASEMQKTGANQTPIFEFISLADRDFTKSSGQKVSEVNAWLLETLQDDKGLDYPFRQHHGGQHWLCAEKSGLRMKVETTYDFVVVYAGGWLDETVPFSQNGAKRPFGGICFETQPMPNGPQCPSGQVGVLGKGELYHHTTSFTFEGFIK